MFKTEDELDASGLLNLDVPMEVDKHYEALANQLSDVAKREGLHHRLTEFGRRATHVAWMMAIDASREEATLVKALPDYERVADLANEAAKRIQLVIRCLAGEHQSKLPDALVSPLAQMARFLSPTTRVEVAHSEAPEKARAIVDALDALQQMGRFAAMRRATLGETRKNIGNIDRKAFLRVHAEAWRFLIGSNPPRGRSSNRFLRLVEAAWQNAGGAEASFTSPLASVLKEAENLTPDSAQRPTWLLNDWEYQTPAPNS